MRANLCLLLLSITVCTLGYSIHDEPGFVFSSWMKEHKFNFQGDEHGHRFGIFKENLEEIKKHNANPLHGWKMGLNRFSHLADHELKSFLGDHVQVGNNKRFSDNCTEDANMPKNWDWRDKKAVSPVKDQGECGSCWAFAATSAMELTWTIRKKDIMSFSEEQLIDCLTKKSERCNGGRPAGAYTYIEKKGITTEKKYPYKKSGKGSDCDEDWEDDDLYSLDSHSYLNGPCDMKKNILKTGVSISFDVDKSFFKYESGVYDVKTCNREGGHAVGVVGYGVTSNGTEYWVMKNSWGKDFGLDGFFKIARGKNLCNVESNPIALYLK